MPSPGAPSPTAEASQPPPGELTVPESLPADHPGLGAPDHSLFVMPQHEEAEGLLRAAHEPLPDVLFAPPGGVAQSPTHARFNPAPPPVALDERDEDTLPFRRCADCGVDSNRFATRCMQCDADLTTPSQLAFQREVAQEVRERQAKEAEAAEVFRREAEASAQSLTAARRAYHEQLAAQQRRRIEGDLKGKGLDDWIGHHSLGDLLLSLVPARFRRPIKWGVIGLAVLFGLAHFASRAKLPPRASGWLDLLHFLPMIALLLFVPFSWFAVSARGHRRTRWW